MPKKLTIEFVRSEFKKKGYNLLTVEYKDSKQKLDYICPKGHKHSICWNSWGNGERCYYCHGRIKLTIPFIRSEFKKEKYTLLTRVYRNNRQKLDYICPNGHKHSISWIAWKNNNRCPYCAGNAKLTIEFIKSKFEKDGYILLSKKYVNANQKLDYICPEGHQCSVSWGNWQSGQKCSYCAGVAKPTIKFIKKEFAKEKYNLLTKEYINCRQKLDYICPEGHRHQITWNDWKHTKNRCPYCVGKSCQL